MKKYLKIGGSVVLVLAFVGLFLPKEDSELPIFSDKEICIGSLASVVSRSFEEIKFREQVASTIKMSAGEVDWECRVVSNKEVKLYMKDRKQGLSQHTYKINEDVPSLTVTRTFITNKEQTKTTYIKTDDSVVDMEELESYQ